MTWRPVRLHDVCNTTSGGTPSREIREYYEGGTIPWVKSGELRDGPILDAEEYITQAAIDHSSAKIFPSGTLLVALYGATAGKLGILKVDAATNQAVCAVFVSDQIDRDFLYYFLLMQRRYLTDSRTGGAQPNISQDTIRNLLLPLPPLAEQQRIAGLLWRADRLRRLRRYALDVSAGYLQAVFVEMFGDPVRNPMGWEQQRLGDVISGFQAGVNIPPISENEQASEWRVLKVSAVTWGDFDPTASKAIPPDTEFDESLIVRKGDLLISRANTTELVGAVSLVRIQPSRVLLPDKLWRICFKEKSQLLPEFTLHALRQEGSRKAIGELATGSSGSMKNISQEKAATLPMALPPLDLQAQFGEIAERSERIRLQQAEALRQAEHLFQALLQRAFAG